MKIVAVVCLVVLTFSSSIAVTQTGAFEKARRIGEANERSFFLFSTSTAKYIIRHDGMGEVGANGRRKVFYLNLSPPSRLEGVYFSEYQGDLLLLYEVSGGRGFLLRMNQQTRKTRWLTPIRVNDIESCVVEGDETHCGAAGELTKIDLRTGKQIN